MTTGNRGLLVSIASMLGQGIVNRGMGLVAMTILSRVLDARGLGAYAFAQSTSQTFAGIARLGADAGLHVGLARLSLPERNAQARALLGEGLTLFIAIAAAVALVMTWLARPIAAGLFAAPELVDFMLASMMLAVSQVFAQYCYTIYAGLSAFAIYSRVTMFSSLLMVALVTSGAFWQGALGAVWGLVASQITNVLLLAGGLRGELGQRGIRVAPRRPGAEAFSILALGMPFYVGGLFITVVDFSCLALLTRKLGVEGLGDLRVSLSLMSLAAMIPMAISGPMISRLAQQRGEGGGGSTTLTQLKVIWSLGLALAIALAAVWPLAIDLVFGGNFAAARTQGVVALAAFIPTMALTVLQGAILAERRSGGMILIGFLHAIVLAIAAWFMIQGYGLAGLFAAQAIAYLIAALLSGALLHMQRDSNMLQDWMLPLTALTLAAFALLTADTLIDETLLVRFAVATAALATTVGVAALWVFTPQERAAMLDLVARITSWLSNAWSARFARDAPKRPPQ